MVENEHAKTKALDVQNLRIQRGTKILLEDLSFGADQGDLIWITGSNGSGKTSLLKCIAGLLRQDDGEIEWSHAPSSIAYLGHQDGHKPILTVMENLEFWHQVYQSPTKIEDIMKQVNIWHLCDLEAKNLSAGQSRRVALARLLLKNAKLWLLDEPAAPMDTHGRGLIADLIGEHIAMGRIALIATHSSPEKIGMNTHVLKLTGQYDG